MLVHKLLLVFLFTRCSVKSEEYVEVQGETKENPGAEVFIKIEANKNLYENLGCRSLRTIKNIKGVSFIPRNYFADLPFLKEIEVKGITGMEPGAFNHVPSLKNIGVTESSLKEIREGLFDHLPINILLLTDNGIETIAPKAFDHIPKLREIHLDWNKLTQWNSDWFLNTPQVFYFSFRENQITELPDEAFKNVLQPSSQLYFNNNNISRVGQKLFTGTGHVSMLDLSHNKLESFNASAFDGIEKIEILNLPHNSIECFYGNLDRIFGRLFSRIDHNRVSVDCAKRLCEWHDRNYKGRMIYWDEGEKCGSGEHHFRKPLHSWSRK